MTQSSPTRASSAAAIVASMLERGHAVRLRLTGWSMKPVFRSGTVVTFTAVPEPVVGDVGLVRCENDALVAHRIVAIEADWLQTKGDACAARDARVPRASLLGCAVSFQSSRGVVPLRNGASRALGRAAGLAYPRLVRTYRALRHGRGPAAW